MDLDTLAKFGEFIGGVFVVVSLVGRLQQFPGGPLPTLNLIKLS